MNNPITHEPTISEYLRSIGVYVALLGAYVAGLVYARSTGSKSAARRYMLTKFTDISFALIKLKIDLTGNKNMPENQPVVVIFNHQSQADGLIIMRLFRDNFAAIGKKEIGRFKPFAMAYEFAGVIPIDRSDTQSAIEAMQPLVDALRVERRNVAIAPEGTRSETAMPGPFKKGAFHVAMQAGVPILPVVIHDAIKIQPKGQFVYQPGTVKVEILPPVSTADWSAESLSEKVEQIRSHIIEVLQLDSKFADGCNDGTTTKSVLD